MLALRGWATSALVAAAVGLVLELVRAWGGLSMAADPTSYGSGLVLGGALGAALAAALGPEWLVVVSTIGAAALGGVAQAGRRRTQGLADVLRITTMWGGASLCLTGLMVWLLQTRAGVQAPAQVLYPAAAFGIGAVGDVALDKARALLRGLRREDLGRGGRGRDL